MDLSKLRMFVKIAELGSLSKASAQYDMGQSTLSRQMSAFEAECKGRLFVRNGRGLSLTELGQSILPQAQALIRDADLLAEDIRGRAGSPSGTVRLAVVPSISIETIATIILEAKIRYPDVTIHVMEGFSGQIEEWLAMGRVDLGFVLKPSSHTISDEPLAYAELCVVGSRDDAFCTGPEINFAELDEKPIILPSQPSMFRSFLEQIARSNGVRFRVVAEIDSVSIMKEVIARGVGYALLSESTVKREVQNGMLSIARLVNPKLSRAVYLSTAAQKSGDFAIREVSRLIRDVAVRLQGGSEMPSVPSAGNIDVSTYVPNSE